MCAAGVLTLDNENFIENGNVSQVEDGVAVGPAGVQVGHGAQTGFQGSAEKRLYVVVGGGSKVSRTWAIRETIARSDPIKFSANALRKTS